MRNSAIRETELLQLVTSHLGELLPSGWDVEVTPGPSLTTGTRRVRADAFLNLRASDGTSASFVVEVKPYGRVSARALVDQVSQYAAMFDRPGVVVTDYANPTLRAACQDYGLGYIDKTGWVHLRHERPALFISHQGASKAPALLQSSSSTIGRLNGPGAGHVIETLFDVHLPIGVRGLAEAARVSPGTVAKVLPVLEHAGAITRSSTGQVVERSRRGLLDRWTQDYDFMRSNRSVTWLLAPRGIDWALTRLRNLSVHGVLDGTAVRFAATGSLGARHFLPPETLSVTPLALASLYCSDPESLAEQLRLRPATKASANVVLVQPRDEAVFHGDSLIGGFLPLVSRARVLADLFTQGGRFIDEAEQLLEVIHAHEDG